MVECSGSRDGQQEIELTSSINTSPEVSFFIGANTVSLYLLTI
jgi:hypothetical protein